MASIRTEAHRKVQQAEVEMQKRTAEFEAQLRRHEAGESLDLPDGEEEPSWWEALTGSGETPSKRRGSQGAEQE